MFQQARALASKFFAIRALNRRPGLELKIRLRTAVVAALRRGFGIEFSGPMGPARRAPDRKKLTCQGASIFAVTALVGLNLVTPNYAEPLTLRSYVGVERENEARLAYGRFIENEFRRSAYCAPTGDASYDRNLAKACHDALTEARAALDDGSWLDRFVLDGTETDPVRFGYYIAMPLAGITCELIATVPPLRFTHYCD